MGKGFGRPATGPGGMLQQMQRLQQQLAEAQAQLAEATVTGTAGGGAVKVVLSGDQRCRSVYISPEVMKEGDAEMLQDLVLAALTTALEQSKALASERLGPLTGGLPFQA